MPRKTAHISIFTNQNCTGQALRASCIVVSEYGSRLTEQGMRHPPVQISFQNGPQLITVLGVTKPAQPTVAEPSAVPAG
eukprot:2319863-Amphidinium_carterae.1